MFAAIYFVSENIQKNSVIPLRWVYSFNPENWINDGMNPSESHKIFFSRNIEDNPNFNSETKSSLDGESGCYSATIRKLFGKQSKTYLFCK